GPARLIPARVPPGRRLLARRPRAQLVLEQRPLVCQVRQDRAEHSAVYLAPLAPTPEARPATEPQKTTRRRSDYGRVPEENTRCETRLTRGSSLRVLVPVNTNIVEHVVDPAATPDEPEQACRREIQVERLFRPPLLQEFTERHLVELPLRAQPYWL